MHLLLRLLPALAVALLATGCLSTQARKDPAAIQLFDGQTLAGWSGRSDLWKVEDGAITGVTSAANPIKNNTFLVWTNGTVANFELRFQYRIFNGNSGVQYRSKLVDAEQFIVGGYQGDLEAGQTYSGILYEERGRGILAQRGQRTRVVARDGKTRVEVLDQVAPGADLQKHIRSEDWNDYLIVANGNHLMHFINGHLMADVLDDQPEQAATSGILAFQIHVGPPMKVQFRDVLLKPLP